jgi:hypothetical protein
MTQAARPGRKNIAFRYRFTFQNGIEKEFTVHLDADTLALVAPARPDPPDWTRLSFHQCPNCPLKEEESPHCPVALNIVDLVTAFQDRKSHEAVQVLVESKERIYAKHTSLQTAASSLIGLHMVTAGCPILSRLRPMVDTHLPFMSPGETTYRMLSMYLVAQHFRAKHGLPADWSLAGLTKLLADIQTVNLAFCKRLNAISIKDASVNALVILSTLGDEARLRLVENDLERLERIFKALMFE